MFDVSIVIPNYNGSKYIRTCLESLKIQKGVRFEVIIVDNASEDDSVAIAQEIYPEAEYILLEKNYGFCRAVNEGIKKAQAPFVLLLNNDTEAAPEFVRNLWSAIQNQPHIFSIEAKMIQLHDRDKIDSAGSYYCALGWAFAYGHGKAAEVYKDARPIFAACGGAAIYRKSVFDEIGYFDEEHFAYLEDIDIGYRARIQGYENWFEPSAVVYHVGSGTSGSRHNEFKVKYSSRNNVYLIYKNMPWPQILLNSPFLIAGFLSKWMFFSHKGFGKIYVRGLKNGLILSRQQKKQKVKFRKENLKNYMHIQGELWKNIIRYMK